MNQMTRQEIIAEWYKVEELLKNLRKSAEAAESRAFRLGLHKLQSDH